MLKWGRHVSAISKVNEKAVTYLYQRWDCIDPIFADVMPKQQPAPTTRSSKRATHIHSGEQTETKKKKRTSTASGSETTEKSRRKYDPESSSSSYDESKWQSPTKKLPQHVEIGYPEKAGSGEYAPKWSREYPHPLWEKHYENIIKMRESKTAPVDTMGCERLADEESSPKVRRYQTLISLMLSSQTKVRSFFVNSSSSGENYCMIIGSVSEKTSGYLLQDQITSEAVYRLRKHGLWPSNIAKTSESEISNIIYPVGFYKRKAQYIKRATDILMEKYDDDIPDSIKVSKTQHVIIYWKHIIEGRI